MALIRSVFQKFSHGLSQIIGTSKPSLLSGATLRPCGISVRNYWDLDNPRFCRYGVVPENVTIKEWEIIKDREYWHHTMVRRHSLGPRWPRKRIHALNEQPQMKGIVIRTCIKKPKKPNSANRKCVLVKLSNGKEKVAFVPGVGHNLQEHSVVLVQQKKVPDVPQLRLRVLRGIYDCAPIVKQSQKPQ
ncbi:30S ribosomal protein S12 technical knockout [Brevipalpus obovatus]|uniref:30S ribosomal protein S12 technical knockout n=1 Tax=Brevipalpus obovatus TaxID=246614 RepID=UPI003D9DC408